jgi:hypothetical protein
MAVPFTPSEITTPFLNVLSQTWPVLLAAMLFSIGASGIMPRGNRRTRRRTRGQPDSTAAEPRSIRIPVSLGILAIAVILFLWGLSRLHSQ